MFKFLIVGLFVLALHHTTARPQAPASSQDSSPPVAIVSQSQSLDGTGSFNYAFESADGVKEEGSGQLKSIKVPKIDPATQQVVGEEDGQGIVQQGKVRFKTAGCQTFSSI